jgi:hypothetical protein
VFIQLGGIGMKFVVYLRVSTDRQSKSGLGLEAQQASVAEYAKASAALLCSSLSWIGWLET